MKFALIAMLPLILAAKCHDDVSDLARPAPMALTQEAAGHYCQMIILDHPGPKAQVYLDGYPAPLWFSQVRDAVAYLKSPEQSAGIVVIYVNDMGKAVSWTDPGSDNWTDAETAYFVVGSDALGGMGAPEIAPFSDPEQARAFSAEHGGDVMQLADIPADLVLSPIQREVSQ